MRYIARQNLNERLRLSRSASYRIVGSTRGRSLLVSTSDVVDLLNGSRRGGQPMVLDIPAELLTGEEMAAAIGEGVTAHDLTCWTRRTLNPAPHFMLNPHCRRFQRSAVEAWLDRQSQIVRRN